MEAKKCLNYESPQVFAFSIEPESIICESKDLVFGALNESGVIEQENIIDGGSF